MKSESLKDFLSRGGKVKRVEKSTEQHPISRNIIYSPKAKDESHLKNEEAAAKLRRQLKQEGGTDVSDGN